MQANFIERIDDDHADPKCVWIEMGQPALPTLRDVEQLQVASRIVRGPLHSKYEADALHTDISMPPHAIAASTVELAPKPVSARVH